MRTMNDRERFNLIVKIFLYLKGPSTSREISNFLESCPVHMQREFTPLRVGMLLRGQKWIKKERINHKMKWSIKNES